ncbi:MAG: response regulator transcription factor [Azospirillum sp.]|nr:response regulator transcription factor [Azospirillum sp.]MCZ8122392.1 response regulator transcription factor [Magnetospirillum sp.]
MLDAVSARKPHILVVDDDGEIRRLTAQLLSENGFRVTAVADGDALRRQGGVDRFDLAVLDVMLPGEDGFALCRHIRTLSDMPIIMLTARADETDRVVGLEIGADDYIVKPFASRELVARIRARLRRLQVAPPLRSAERRTRFSFDGWMIDSIRRELRAPDGTIISLTSTEFDLLIVFVERPQRVLSRDELLDLVHGRSAHPFDRSIDVSISRLRKKIEAQADEPRFIRTVRNGGYVFSTDVVAEPDG